MSRQQFRLTLVKRVLAAGAIALVTLLGVISALGQLFPVLITGPSRAAICLVGSVVIAAIVALKQTRPDLQPLDDIAINPGPGHSFTIESTTSRQAVLAVHAIARAAYDDIDPIPVDRYEHWLRINQHIFVCLFDHTRTVRGYFDVFPLRDDFMKLLVAGTVGELDIRAEHMLPPDEARNASNFYLAGLAIGETDTHEGRRFASMLVWGLCRYVKYYCIGPEPRQLLAAGNTKKGEALLVRCGFRQVASSEGRRDPFPLYSLELSEASVSLIEESLPDWSRLVACEWARPTPLLRIERSSRRRLRRAV